MLRQKRMEVFLSSDSASILSYPLCTMSVLRATSAPQKHNVGFEMEYILLSLLVRSQIQFFSSY